MSALLTPSFPAGEDRSTLPRFEDAAHPARSEGEAAQPIARVLLEGFDRHYRLFREAGRKASRLFANADWLALQQVATERINYYDTRVSEAVQRLIHEFGADTLPEQVWLKIKQEYILLLTAHKQPELAESFFNSVCCQILHRSYYHNAFIFVRPGVSTEHIDSDPPAYQSYYPLRDGLRSTLHKLIADKALGRYFTDMRRDIRRALRCWRLQLPYPLVLEANHQIQVLSGVFYRNTSAYIVGKMINGGQHYPFAVALMHDGAAGGLKVDTVLLTHEQLAILMNSSRAYFMVDMEVPSAYVNFLRSLLPEKARSELYSILGLHKQGKTLFYRDFLHHLKHSSDDFIIAPGIRGLVMAVFTLPSYPYVFKLIKDVISPPKQINRDQVITKYQLVKHHDRVGRMADTLEYSDVPFPRSRFTPELLQELRTLAPSSIEESADIILIRHLYIERRLVPLNLYMDRATDLQMENVIVEFGNALKELAAVNIFAGDLLFKNFGVTRFGRVVFYDYDEIDYLTDCNFRKIPPPRHEEDEMAAEPWYSVNPNDIFPEEFDHFLLINPRVRTFFLKHHPQLLDYHWWQETQAQIKAGKVRDVMPYPEYLRFHQLFKNGISTVQRVLRRVSPEGFSSTLQGHVATRKRFLGRFSFDSE